MNNRDYGESGWRAFLAPGEKLRWEGAPATGLRLRKADALLIPFSLAWGGFAAFWEATALSMDAPLLFKLAGLPFVLIGLYIVIGRFYHDAWLRARTRYALTDERALIAINGFSRQLHSIPLHEGRGFRYFPGKLASFVFDVVRPQWARKRNALNEFVTPSDGFYFQENGEALLRLLMDIQSKADKRP